MIYPSLNLNFIYKNDGQYPDRGRIVLVGEVLYFVVVSGHNTGRS